MLTNSTILITGGTGSWGKELTRQLLQMDVAEIRIYSRGEYQQYDMSQKFKDKRIKYIIGDVRDVHRLQVSSIGCDYIFHLAALKHVPICEDHPTECIDTNILGSQNVITASINNNVKKVIYVSTDKAVEPSNTYGMSKSIAERLFQQANKLSDTKFVTVRGGNVLGTNGSVVPFFKECIKTTNNLPVTNFEMTRFFITLPEAISLLFKALYDGFGGETFVIRMNAFKIYDLAKLFKDKLGDYDTTITEIGLRPGEKIHELLVSKQEVRTTYTTDTHYIILPDMNINNIYEHYDTLNYPKIDIFEYSSNQFLCHMNKLADLLGV